MNRIFPVLALMLALVGTAWQVGYAQAAQPTVRELVFQGVEHLSADAQAQMRKVVTLAVGQPYAVETANADVERISGLGWFVRASVRTEPVEGGVRVIFTVVENPMVTAIDFIGNSVFSDAQLLQVISTRPGQVLNRNQVAPDAQAIKKAYADQGYTLVEVTDINITPEGRLEFVIFEPRIGEIRIEGNSKTQEYVIRRQLEVKPGDVYRTTTIRKSLTNLEQLGLFDEVTAVPDPGTEPGTLTLTVRVRERDHYGMLSLGAGTSNIQGIFGFIDVSNNNLFGSGQRGSVRAQFGSDPSYQISYTNPWTFGRNRHEATSMTVNAYDRITLRQAEQAGVSSTYHELRRGGDISFGREVADFTRAYLTFRADSVKASSADTLPASLESLHQWTNVRSIGVSTVYDVRGRRNTNNDFVLDVQNPTEGSYANGAVEFAGFGGADFMKLTGDVRRYVPIYISGFRKRRATDEPIKRRPPWVYASRLLAGTITGAPPFLDQFLVGGADTLRGYKEDRYPGQNMLVWNNELRFPIADALQLVTFADLGDAWGGDFARDAGDAKPRLHLGYGLGVRVITPIGPLRLDYGWAASGGNEFHFGVGATF
jgi:outer membrane protein insertion porin family